MRKQNLKKLILSALFAALTCVATMVIRVPSPTSGYVNLGDVIVLLSAFLLGPIWGAAAAGMGSMLADLLSGYALYAPGTLVIKFSMALVAGLLYMAFSKKWQLAPAALIGGIFAEAVMIAGYFLYDAFILGYGPVATLANIPGNAVQGGFGIVISLALLAILSRVAYVRELTA